MFLGLSVGHGGAGSCVSRKTRTAPVLLKVSILEVEGKDQCRYHAGPASLVVIMTEYCEGSRGLAWVRCCGRRSDYLCVHPLFSVKNPS